MLKNACFMLKNAQVMPKNAWSMLNIAWSMLKNAWPMLKNAVFFLGRAESRSKSLKGAFEGVPEERLRTWGV